jgi:2-polyprenyl-6-methoxyphenol hydroxylase-like FAD-dependent oxidoreductase
MLADRVEALDTWDDVRFLSVSIDRLRRWYRPGLRCIGDAAHVGLVVDPLVQGEGHA